MCSCSYQVTTCTYSPPTGPTPTTPITGTPVTPTTPTIPDYCPAHSNSCQRIMEKMVNSSKKIKIDLGIICISVCVDLAQERPECFGIELGRFIKKFINYICTPRIDGKLCGVVTYIEQTIASVLNIFSDCFSPGCPGGIRGINCTNSSCVHAYQAYINHLGCCFGTAVENSHVNISRSCLPDLQIPPPCPGEHAANHLNYDLLFGVNTFLLYPK